MSSINRVVTGQGKPLVLLHGWGFDYRVWLPLAEVLQHDYCLYLIDLPGFGKTAMMDWPAFKKEVLAFLPEQFAVLGWSMGGLYAMRLAIEEPARVRRLLVTGSTPCFIKSAIWPGIEPSVLDGFSQRLEANPEETLRDFMTLQSGKRQKAQTYSGQATKAGLEEGLSVLTNWDLRQSLKKLALPACFIFGGLDAIVPRKTMSAMQSIYPDFDYHLIPKAAHMPFISHPELFVSHLL